MMRPATTKCLSSNIPSVRSWIGEASSGRSATTPTFFKSTSVLTTTDRQCSQTVYTLRDQRYAIGAPQFGQLAARLGMPVGTIEPAHVDGPRAQQFGQLSGKIPVGSRAAGEQIQAEAAVLRKRVAGEMRLRQHADAGDAA